ncbi:hypothetical protein B0H11DRAFT_2319406 [Mycena galericulata]|nr:hypothetical protein B0H11DRAFT_2319406 [Mycena galericulata]
MPEMEGKGMADMPEDAEDGNERNDYVEMTNGPGRPEGRYPSRATSLHARTRSQRRWPLSVAAVPTSLRRAAPATPHPPCAPPAALALITCSSSLFATATATLLASALLTAYAPPCPWDRTQPPRCRSGAARATPRHSRSPLRPTSLDEQYKQPDWLQFHPFVQIPYIDTDGFILYEYLVAAYPGEGLALVPAPSAGVKARALFDQALSVEAFHFDPTVAGISMEQLHTGYM